jgi:uncharacterized protein with FMN-binding domain
VTLVGATAVALATPGASPVAAVAAPGQPVENDYGQSAAEVAAEIAPVVAADPAVIRSAAAQAKAREVVLARAAAQARAKAAYLAAARYGGRTPIKRTYAAYVAAIAATAKAKTAYAAAIKTATATRATVTARVRATHYQPKDGVFTGVLKSYLVPTVPFSFEPMQVQITVYGGHVSDVVVTAQAEPTTDSASYNDKSLSTLTLEAMAADGTSEVAAVSGASLTSRAFADSLHSALVAAGFKG